MHRILLSCASSCPWLRAPRVAADRPNIIFIMTDDHAAHAISAYGSRVNQTPHLDRLAREGALFENVFATNSICTPSRAAILTGQYSHINGVTMFNRFDSTPHDRRAPAAAGRLLHRHDRQVASRQRSRRLRSLGDPARDRAPTSIRFFYTRDRRDDLHRPLCHRRHHRSRARLHREAAAGQAVLPDDASQGAASAVAADAEHAAQFADAADPRAGDVLGLVRDAHRRAAREPAARRDRSDAPRSQAAAAVRPDRRRARRAGWQPNPTR